jgi:hypothetical protein
MCKMDQKLCSTNLYADFFMNIYKEGNNYKISGVVGPDSTRFYLVFYKRDQEMLPFAIDFSVNDSVFETQMFQLLIPLPNDDNLSSIYSGIFFQYCENCLNKDDPASADELLSNLYYVDISPSFPFSVEISGFVRIDSSRQTR